MAILTLTKYILYLQIQAAEIKFLWSIAGYRLMDHNENYKIRKELNILSLKKRITEYRNKWKEHLEWQPDNNITKQVL
jgi:hypothetical protein